MRTPVKKILLAPAQAFGLALYLVERILPGDTSAKAQAAQLQEWIDRDANEAYAVSAISTVAALVVLLVIQ